MKTPRPRVLKRASALALSSACAGGVLLAFFNWRETHGQMGRVELELLDPSFFETDAPSDELPYSAAPARAGAPPLYRRGLTPGELAELQHVKNRLETPDPHAVFVYTPYQDHAVKWAEHPRGGWRHRTNALGQREDNDPSPSPPDVRILVVGDSHTDGVCDNSESFPQQLESILSANDRGRTVEVLNAGRGGYNFYNYLGAIERLAWLQPDVVIVAVYGGNDFEGVLTLRHRFEGTKRPWGARAYGDQLKAAEKLDPAGLPQHLISLKYFAQHPSEIELALETSNAVSAEIESFCERLGAVPIFVYIPPLIDVQAEQYRIPLEELRAALELERDDLGIHDRLADSHLEFLRSSGVRTLDLRPQFRASPEPMYWARDHHINVDAQRRIAEQLAPIVEQELELSLPLRASSAGRAARGTEALGAVARGGPTREELLRLLMWLARTAPRQAEPVAPNALPSIARRPAQPLALRQTDSESGAPVHAVLLRDVRSGEREGDRSLSDRLNEEREARGLKTSAWVDGSELDVGLNRRLATIPAAAALGAQLVLVVFDEAHDWLPLFRPQAHATLPARPDSTGYLTAAELFKEHPAEALRAKYVAATTFAAMSEECKRSNMKLCVVRFPSSLAVDAAAPWQRRDERAQVRALDRTACAAPRDASRDLMARLRAEQIEVLDLEPVLQALPFGGCDPSGQLSDYAQSLVAGLLALRMSETE